MGPPRREAAGLARHSPAVQRSPSLRVTLREQDSPRSVHPLAKRPALEPDRWPGLLLAQGPPRGQGSSSVRRLEARRSRRSRSRRAQSALTIELPSERGGASSRPRRCATIGPAADVGRLAGRDSEVSAKNMAESKTACSHGWGEVRNPSPYDTDPAGPAQLLTQLTAIRLPPSRRGVFARIGRRLRRCSAPPTGPASPPASLSGGKPLRSQSPPAAVPAPSRSR
mgnify:CR=1 FL=1